MDSHELVALCAPRPVFLSAGNSIDPAVDIGNSDAWVDAEGRFLAPAAPATLHGFVLRHEGQRDTQRSGISLMDGD